MKVFIVYCHPSDDSFTKHMCDAFIRGITDAGHEYIVSDLYKMGFDPVMTEQEYLRDANYKTTPEVADDVRAEQEKINSADAIAFIYPNQPCPGGISKYAVTVAEVERRTGLTFSSAIPKRQCKVADWE